MPDAVAERETVRKKPVFHKDIASCIIVLVVIALVAGVLLGALNYLTYVDPNAAIAAEVAGIYGVTEDKVAADSALAVNPDGASSKVLNAFRIYDAEGNTRGVAYYVSGSGAYSGTVEFVVCVEDGIVTAVGVYSHSETASIGGKVLKEDNLARLTGTDLTAVSDYGSAGADDAKQSDIYVSGATRTTRAALNALRATAYAWNTCFGEGEV